MLARQDEVALGSFLRRGLGNSYDARRSTSSRESCWNVLSTEIDTPGLGGTELETTAPRSETFGVDARGARRTWAAGAGIAERALALCLLLLALPLLGLLALFVLAADGWPAFYRGERLGRGRRPFTLYKLRTLKRGAEQAVGGALLGQKQELVIRGGTFLRDTRLDELPQLWNVVRGDMALLGPRPERAEVYRTQCAAIPGYALRFDVRPGLIGVSQLFTPHGTARRYRTLLDNHAIRRGGRLGDGLGVIAFTVWVVGARIVQRLGRKLETLYRWNGLAARRGRRRLRRVTPEGALAFFATDAGPVVAHVLDMNEQTLRVECLTETGELRVDDFRLGTPIDRGSARPVWHAARCRGQVLARRSAASGEELVLRFEPTSARSEYMLHQYFLRTSLATRHAPWRTGALPATPSPTLAALKRELAGRTRIVRTANGASVPSCLAARPRATLAARGSPAHWDPADRRGARHPRRAPGSSRLD